MEESQKGASSTSDMKKKNLPIDDEIGKDFLNSWKLTANEKAVIEFTNEIPSRSRKTMFDFDKLDDLVFGEDFGKMASFQMDMSDLDFSSPPKKIEKTIEKSEKDFSHEKRKNKQETFTFSFDFNELEDFDLDSNLLKGRKKFENDTDNKRSDFCNRSDNACDSQGTSTTNTSGTQKGLKDMNKSDEAISEISGYMTPHMVVDVVSHGTSSALKNKCSKEIFNLDKQITVSQGNKTDNKKSEGQKENECIPAHENLIAEKVPQVLSIQSSDVTPLEAPSVHQIGDEVDLLVHKSDVEKEKSRELQGSPDSRSSSFANAPSLKNASKSCNSDASGFGSLDQSDLNHDSLNDKRTEQMMNVGITPLSTVSGKPACLTKTEEKRGSGQKNLLPSLCRKSSSDAKHALPKISFLKPLNGEVKQTRQASQECISKNLSGEVTKQNEQAFHKFNSSKTLYGGEPIQRLAIPENDGYRKESLISASPKQTTAHIGTLNSMPKLGDQAHLKLSKINSVEKYGLSSITNNTKHDASRFSLKMNTSNSTNQKKSSLISIRDMNAGRKSPKSASTEMKEKSASLSPSLKRKSFEGSVADSASLKTFKGSPESPNWQRIIVGMSPKTKEQLVLNSEDNETCTRDAFPGPQNSPSNIPVVKSVMDIDVQVNLEDDENVQKAEACAKELEDICNMLKKKHDEAKELLVRAVVNNNLLLMLNHPIHEEKIRNLQKFAGGLVSMDYDF